MIDMTMAPKIVETTPVVISKAFDLWKQREANEKRRITIDEVIGQVGLAKNTVRRFLEPNGDVSGSPLSSAAAFARYFGVSVGEVVEMETGSASANAGIDAR